MKIEFKLFVILAVFFAPVALIYGFFSPHSWWPFFLAAAASIVPLGAIFGIWVLLFGIVATLVAISGFVLEYYVNEP